MNGKIKKMLSAVSISLCETVGLSLPVDVVAATLPKAETEYRHSTMLSEKIPKRAKLSKN